MKDDEKSRAEVEEYSGAAKPFYCKPEVITYSREELEKKLEPCYGLSFVDLSSP